MEFDYAHNNTAEGEKKSSTAAFVNLHLPAEIAKVRADAFARQIPTADDETLNFILTLLAALQPVHMLEIGTATGISGICMLHTCPTAQLTTVEKNADFFKEAQQNFAAFRLDSRVTPLLGDAGDVIETLHDSFDFIFLDSAKVQYVKYLPRLKKLLKKGGMLIADDVLLYGWVNGEAPTPPKRRMLVTHIREYIELATHDEELNTTVVNVGDGLCISVKV